MTFGPLSLEVLMPGSLMLHRAYRAAYPQGYWKPPPPRARTNRVDPPAGHQHRYAVLYMGDSVASTAVEARLLQQDEKRRWFVSKASADEYHLASYTLSKPAVVLPIDGPNAASLGLDDLRMAFEPDYASPRAMALSVYESLGSRVDGFSWQSFRSDRPGRVVALFHGRKRAVGLEVASAPPHPRLLDSAEWLAFATAFPGIEVRDA